MVTKSRALKHKDHVKKTQLDWVFCIQNFLDAPQALELLSRNKENKKNKEQWSQRVEH